MQLMILTLLSILLLVRSRPKLSTKLPSINNFKSKGFRNLQTEAANKRFYFLKNVSLMKLQTM